MLPATVCPIFMGPSAKNNMMTANPMLQGQTKLYPNIMNRECLFEDCVLNIKLKNILIEPCD